MAESDETARAIVAGQTGSLEVVKMALSNVRFVQKADIGTQSRLATSVE
jgi:hypothetical protein